MPQSVSTKESDVICQSDVFFYPRCHSANLFNCKMPDSARNPVANEGDVLKFFPGDNYLLMETAVSSPSSIFDVVENIEK